MLKKFFTASLVFILGTGISFTQSQKYTVDYTKGFVKAYGSGCSEPGTPEPLAQMEAEEAARTVALNNLAEAIKGVRIVGYTTIRKMQFKDSYITRAVNAFLIGATVCPDSNPTYIYNEKAEIGCYKNYCLMIGITNSPQGARLLIPIIKELKKKYPSKPPKVEEIAPKGEKTEQIVSKPDLQQVDGVIIDVREIPDYSPSLAPIIETKDIANRPKVVFAASMVDEDVVRRKGAVAAQVATKQQLDSVLQAWGIKHPLIIKARGIDPTTGAIIISNEDAVKLIAADQKNNFLSKGNVVIWMSPSSQTALSY